MVNVPVPHDVQELKGRVPFIAPPHCDNAYGLAAAGTARTHLDQSDIIIAVRRPGQSVGVPGVPTVMAHNRGGRLQSIAVMHNFASL